MKYLIYSMLYFTFFCFQTTTVLAAEHPEGDITFYNSSNKDISAQVNSGKVVLAANAQKNISYSNLSQACSSTPTSCTARFYVENTPVGYATINSVTGKLINMKLLMKVSTSKNQQVLRSVVIK